MRFLFAIVPAVTPAWSSIGLSQGKLTLSRDSEAQCETCGGRVAPQAMLQRIKAFLGEDHVIGEISRYCLTCRGTELPGLGRQGGS